MKKLISIFLAAVMLLSLAACGQTASDAASDAPASSDPSADTSSETPSDPPEGEAPAMADGETPPEKPDGTPPDGENGQPGVFSYGSGTTVNVSDSTITTTADAQTLDGNILVDTISSLNLTLKNGSTFTGTVNIAENTGGRYRRLGKCRHHHRVRLHLDAHRRLHHHKPHQQRHDQF